MSDIRQITSISEWKERSQPLVDIQGFEPGEYFTVRLRSVSLLALCKTGKIPNALLEEATKLFTGAGGTAGDNSQIDEATILANLNDTDGIMQIIDTVVESAMVEPTYNEVRDFITDAQKMEIFQWTQGGVESLKSFREEQGNIGLSHNEQDV